MINLGEQWVLPPDHLVLNVCEIHIWSIILDQPPGLVQRLSQHLTNDERARASRYCFEHDRTRFSVGRGALREILSRYIGVEPRKVPLEIGPYGKPQLARMIDEKLCFNVSHSNGLGILVITCGQEIGVDIEYIRAVDDEEQIAQRFFSVKENSALLALPAEERHKAFFSCWTRKEAFIKAIGEGLSHPLDQFDVSLAPLEPAWFLSVDGSIEKASQWSLFSFTPAPHYTGAIATEKGDWQISYWKWEESYDG